MYRLHESRQVVTPYVIDAPISRQLQHRPN
jgi:hypothetical protein